ncbi:uncharacterized protein LOC126997728 [Eriocheir sinensis]|uniref:uncharacterized protein LOC126997728 n=1 Tax=Eriocheir sinensis TaxID=95602 RepID=UPI0021CAD4F0|nr:uncharacterized protein LOC126997728 [Eriocheir sinensis]
MKFPIILTMGLIALLPAAQTILLLETGSAVATSSTIGITLGSTGGGAAAATLGTAALVVGALVVGGVVLAGAGNRFKRDVSNYCVPAGNPDLFVDLAARADQAGCGLKLVCELEATPDEALSRDELLILNLIGRHVKPPTFSQMKNGRASFQYAALVGERAEGLTECSQVFDQCPFDRAAIMGAFDAMK